ncbi:MAG: hypothetical protein DCC65_04910 [Planctomycetota bacterium]|nr:MAG: hypothetical protein DCC65_04910 [Planctomycetota bacterium]
MIGIPLYSLSVLRRPAVFRRIHPVAIVAIVALLPAASSPAQQGVNSKSEPDDRPSARQRTLAAELTERGMPELVEALFSDAPTMHQIHVARAYSRAARDEQEPARRQTFVERAEKCYQFAINLENNAEWHHGLRRAFAIAEWRAEYADFVLSVACGPDLDQYEITSGLHYERARLIARLKEAEALHRTARERLDEMLIDLRTQEEKFLLLGLSSRVEKLSREQLVSSAWTTLFLGMLSDPGTMGRKVRLDSALGIFDLVQRTAPDDEGKYNATLGAGIALRELERASESEAAFKRVIESTMPPAMVARARYELARLFILRERFDRARQELAVLASTPDGMELPGASFYVRLAPVLIANADILEARSSHCPPAQKDELTRRATQSLMELADRGGFWTAVAQVYLALLDDDSRDPSKMDDDELFMRASRLMLAGRHEPALAAWTEFLRRKSAAKRRGEALFNLGVCQFQTGDHAAAAQTFAEVVETNAKGDLAERAAVNAYHCLREQAGKQKKKESYIALAAVADALVARFPENTLASEAVWVGALALQEAEEYDNAVDALKKIRRGDARYWEARYRSAVCVQAKYDGEAGRLGEVERQRRAHAAAATWRKFVTDLAESAGRAPAGRSQPAAPADQAIQDWERAARLSAAELYASPEVRRYDEGLAILPAKDDAPRALGLRLRCLRGAGRADEAEAVLKKLLDGKPTGESKRTLLSLAAEMDRQIETLVAQGRAEQAVRAAVDVIPVLRRLLQILDDSPTGRRDQEVVRFSLARALGVSGQVEEARQVYDQLMSKDPYNGAYIRAAALMEEMALEKGGTAASIADANHAEKLWARLLEDPSLRERSSSQYWEARYYWLRHQLRHGRAELVSKGIASERVWYPDLGGPPWQARLLELAGKAGGSGEGTP